MEKQVIIDEIRKCYDPEVPINIYDMGLIYEIEENNGDISIKMTLTSMGCPAGPLIVQQVKDKVGLIPGIKNVDVVIVWEPAWSPDKMTEDARLEMGMM